MSVDVFRAGNVAVVTGAALGIGRAACQRFAELGMSVCLADLAGEDLESARVLAAEASPRGTDAVLMHPTDVSDPDQMGQLQRAVDDRFGVPHLLMNNAVTRIGRGGPVDLAVWRRAFDVNFWGCVQGVEAFLPGMLARGA
ncbi:MAG: SDR family NAD(P)-dependent oxidoreductase, partial [Hyphomicrobiaceae bacterium]